LVLGSGLNFRWQYTYTNYIKCKVCTIYVILLYFIFQSGGTAKHTAQYVCHPSISLLKIHLHSLTELCYNPNATLGWNIQISTR